MNRVLRLLLVLSLLGGGQARALAQTAVTRRVEESARVLTLDEALRRSLQFNPEIAKLGASLAEKLGRAIETEVKINPLFKVTEARTSESSGDGNFV
nr:hypothetical protein [Verrucomicrobiota bacterium]